MIRMVPLNFLIVIICFNFVIKVKHCFFFLVSLLIRRKLSKVRDVYLIQVDWLNNIRKKKIHLHIDCIKYTPIEALTLTMNFNHIKTNFC